MISLFLSETTTEYSSIFEALNHNTLFGVAILLIFGLIGGKIVDKFHFPKVTGYILIGILIGPSVMGLLSHELVDNFKIITETAIGFIGYTIGLELKFSKMKKSGKQIIVITLVQAIAAALFVCLAIVLIVKEHNWTYGLIMGAIATATAPAPIIAVVKDYRTKGPVTDTLLPLVALDDAIGIILFAILLSFGTSILNVGGETLSFMEMMWEPLREILVSIVAGAALGLMLVFVVKKFVRERNDFLMIAIVGTVILGIGLGQVLHASAILLPMTIGIVLTNMIDERLEHRLTEQTDLFSAPVLLSFFTLAGAELDLSIIPTIGLIGIVYLIVRIVGKVAGATVSAKAVKAPPTVIKYLGWTLIPQAGVAINMALTVDLKFKELVGFEHIGAQIVTVVLAATVIYEIFGIIVVKFALGKAGEIDRGNQGWDVAKEH